MRRGKEKIIICSFQSDYYMPSPKMVKVIDKKQDKILSKVQDIRYDEIYKANRKFDWSDENVAKLKALSDALHEKMQELLQKLKQAEKQAKVFGEYVVKARLKCFIVLPDEDEFECTIAKVVCTNEHPVDEFYLNLEKNFSIGYTKLGYNLSYPMYCAIDEHRLSLEETVKMQPENFFIKINIEV